MKKKPLIPVAALALSLSAVSACKPREEPPVPGVPSPPDVCSNADGALGDARFIFVTAPRPGERTTPGFTVTGCSRTFESTVNWRLKSRDGTVLASGHANGGGVDGAAAFSFAVDYKVPQRQIGHLELEEEDASDGEGNPPPRNVIPVVLSP